LLYDFSKEKIYKTGFRAKNLIKEPKIKTIVWIDACESEAAAKDLIDNKVDLLVSSSENECPYSDWRGSAFTNTLLEGELQSGFRQKRHSIIARNNNLCS